MRNDVTSEQDRFLVEERVSSSRQARAGNMVAILLLFLLVVPTIKILPGQASGGLNRTLLELANFSVVAIWMCIRIFYGRYVQLRPRWFEAALWLLPITFVISDLVYALNGGSLGLKHIYEILNSLQPIAFIQFTMFIFRWGKVKLARFGNVMRILANVIAFGVIYIGLLAVLQMLGVSFVMVFLSNIYKFYAEGLENIAYAAVQNYGRATSIFHWATSLGAFLAVALLFLFIYVLDHPNRRETLLHIIAIVFGLFGIVLSGSRMAFLALAIGLFITLILRRQFKVIVIIIVGGAIILFAMGFVEQKTGQVSRFTELFNFISGTGGVPATLSYRFGNMSSIISAFLSSNISHLTGTTVTNFETIVPRSFDNEYLKYLVWNGYLGLLAFILLQAGVIYRSWLAFRLFTRHTPGNTLSLSLLAVSISLAVTAYSQEVWSGERVPQLVFIILGVLTYFRKLQAANSVEVPAE